MAIVTRCPACNTVFRVAPPQLQARNGMVRCGRCMTVFDGFKTLSNITEPAAGELVASAAATRESGEPASAIPDLAGSHPAPESPVTSGAAPVVAEAEPAPAPVATEVTPAPLPLSAERSPFLPADERSPFTPSDERAPFTRSDEQAPFLPSNDRAPSVPAVDRTPSPSSTQPPFRLEAVSATELAAAALASGKPFAKSDGAEEAKDFGPAPEQLTLEDHLFLEETRDAKVRSARRWGAGAVLALLVLAAQAAYFYRGEIAAHYPSARPHLASLCEKTGCAIHLPQRPQLIAIEASDLQATDPLRPNVIQLTATVRNHAGHALGFPAMDLVLTNSRDHTLARRIFQPRDYLEPGRDANTGIPAKAEMTITLDLDTADLRPAGFRIDLMAAQQE